MKTYRKTNALGILVTGVAITMSSCSSIDDNLDDCYIDMQAEYELRLVTNEQQELARVLSDRPDIANALQQHLSSVFTDNGRDLDLSFYVKGTRSYQQTENMNNAPTKHVSMMLPIEDYEHLAIANVQGNGIVTPENTDNLSQTKLTVTSIAENIVASQRSGIFTGRRSFPNMQWGTYPYHMPLYMANSAAAVVLDPRSALFTDIKVYSTGFATSFNVADSTYQYDNSPLVRHEQVNLPNTNWLCYCGVSLPSREPSSTRAITQTDQPFLYDDCGEDIWQYEIYITMADGTPNGIRIKEGTITRNIITVRHPLRAGQLKVFKGWIDNEGRIQTEDMEVGVSVDINWKPGIEWEY